MVWHRHRRENPPARRRLVADGGEPPEEDDETAANGTESLGDDGGTAEASDDAEESDTSRSGAVDRSTVEVSEPGDADPADPKWEPPDMDDIPEFEVRADEPVVKDDSTIGDGPQAGPGDAGDADDPTAGMPNTARAPGATRVSTDSAESYIVAMEICAQLPEAVRLPEEAADLVPAAVEAELEQDVEAFAASEFGTRTPTVDTLTFDEVDGDIWLRLRIGVPPDAFADLDPDTIRQHALQELEGVL